MFIQSFLSIQNELNFMLKNKCEYFKFKSGFEK